MSEAIERRLNELRQVKDQYAKAQARRVYLEHFRKSKLAILMNGYSREHATAAAQERMARAHPEYVELLDALETATEQAEKLYWELRISLKGADLWQTEQASKRAEHRAYQST